MSEETVPNRTLRVCVLTFELNDYGLAAISDVSKYDIYHIIESDKSVRIMKVSSILAFIKGETNVCEEL